MRLSSLTILPLAVVTLLLRVRPAQPMLDLHEVHRLCQAREFYSFRRKVCTLVRRKRSLDADAGDENRLSDQLPDTSSALPDWFSSEGDRTNLVGISFTSPVTNQKAAHGSQTPMLSFPYFRLSNSRREKYLQPPNSNAEKIMLTHRVNVSGNHHSGRQSNSTLLEDLFFLSSGNSHGSSELHRAQYSVPHPQKPHQIAITNETLLLLNMVEPNGSSVNENHTTRHQGKRVPLMDLLAFHLLDKPNNPYLMDHEASYQQNQKPKQVSSSESDHGPPVVESGVIFNPADAFQYQVQGFEDEVGTYSHWGSDWEDAPASNKPGWSEDGATIGMLREHCCLYGCTLNRHFHNFLSTCVTMR